MTKEKANRIEELDTRINLTFQQYIHLKTVEYMDMVYSSETFECINNINRLIELRAQVLCEEEK